MLINGERICVVDGEIVIDMCLPILPHNWYLCFELSIMHANCHIIAASPENNFMSE